MLILLLEVKKERSRDARCKMFNFLVSKTSILRNVFIKLLLLQKQILNIQIIKAKLKIERVPLKLYDLTDPEKMGCSTPKRCS